MWCVSRASSPPRRVASLTGSTDPQCLRAAIHHLLEAAKLSDDRIVVDYGKGVGFDSYAAPESTDAPARPAPPRQTPPVTPTTSTPSKKRRQDTEDTQAVGFSAASVLCVY